MTTRSKAKSVAAPAPLVLKNYYVGQVLENLYHVGRHDSIGSAITSAAFNECVEDEGWEGEVLYFLEVDDKDNVTSHKYRVRQAGYVIEKP